jgi:hypothetical protein
MPIRGYLSEWQLFDDGEPEGLTFYSPAIEPALMQREVGHAQYFDLRTAEQQGQVPAQGWALVLVNVTPPDHNVIMQTPNTHEVNAGTSVSEIRAIIGDEATDDVFEGSTIEQLKAYFQSVHRGRVNRWQGRT